MGQDSKSYWTRPLGTEARVERPTAFEAQDASILTGAQAKGN